MARSCKFIICSYDKDPRLLRPCAMQLYFPMLVHHPGHTGQAQLDINFAAVKELALARRGLLCNYHAYCREKLLLEPVRGAVDYARCPPPTVVSSIPKTFWVESPFITLRFWSSSAAPHLTPPERFVYIVAIARELVRVVLQLHHHGVEHGNLAPDTVMIATTIGHDPSRIPNVDLRLVDFDRSCPVKEALSTRTACNHCKPFARRRSSTYETIYHSPTDDRCVEADAWAIGVMLIELMRPELLQVIQQHSCDLKWFHIQQLHSGHSCIGDPYGFFCEVEDLYNRANLPHLFQAKFRAREQLLAHALVLIRYSKGLPSLDVLLELLESFEVDPTHGSVVGVSRRRSV
jgi:hypothetical protein